MAQERYKNVLIVGGTGGLGRHIVRGFLNYGGFNISVLVRPTTLRNADGNKTILLTEMRQRGVTLVEGDFYVHESLVDVMKGIDVVVTSISSLAPDSKEQHVDGERNLIRAAQAANVKYFIPAEFGGDSRIILGNDSHPLFEWNREIGEVLKESGMEYTHIYTAMFMEYIIWYFTGLDLKTKTFEALDSLDFRFSTIAQEDIGNLLPHIVLSPTTTNKHIHIAGDLFSMRQLRDYYSEAYGPIEANVLTSAALAEKLQDTSDLNWLSNKFKTTCMNIPPAFCFTEPWNKKYLPDYKTMTVRELLREIERPTGRAKLSKL